MASYLCWRTSFFSRQVAVKITSYLEHDVSDSEPLAYIQIEGNKIRNSLAHIFNLWLNAAILYQVSREAPALHVGDLLKCRVW